MFKTSTLCPLVIVLCSLVFLGCAVNKHGNIGSNRTFMLTWEPANQKDDLEYFLNAKSIGISSEAIPTLKAYTFGKVDTFKIIFPKEEELRNTSYIPPYSATGLINLLIRNGVCIEFYWRGNKLPIHTLTWEVFPKLSYCYLEARYIFDGADFDVGREALKKIIALKLEKDSLLLILYPWITQPSGFDWLPPYRHFKFLEIMREKGVLIHELEESYYYQY